MVAKSSTAKKKSTAKTKSNPENKEIQKEESFSLEEYTPYIKELRGAFWKVIVFFAFGAVVGMSYYKQILSVIMGFFKLENINLVLTSPYQFINLAINSGFFIGVVFSLPILMYYLLQFTKPALKPKEFKLLLYMLPISIVLFTIGFGFGVWVLQYVVDLFSKTSTSLEIGNIWDLSGFMSQIVIMGLALAFVFQMPIVITALLKLKIVSYDAISEKRRIIYAGLLVFAALMPPTDLIALGLLTLIPLFLFEITLLLNKHIIN